MPKLWGIVFLLAGLVFLAHFNRVSISVAANAHFIGEGRLSNAQMGMVYSAFLLSYTILMLPGGWFIDRIGPRRALGLMGIGLGAWTVITGLLGQAELAVAAMFVPLLVIRSLAGVTSVPLHPGAARSVSLWVPLERRSLANGLVTAGALLGVALCYPVFGTLMNVVGWPNAFAICGTVLILFAVSWHLATAGLPEHAVEGSRPTLREMCGLLKNRSLVLLALSYGAIGYVQYLFFYWIEYYFAKVLNVPADESRVSSMIIALAMAAGMFVGGWVSDAVCHAMGRARGCRLIAIGGMGLGGALSWLGLGTANADMVTLWFSLSFACLGLCEGIFWTTAPLLEPRSGGLACAVVNTSGNGFGLLAPIMTPILGDAFGWNSAIIVACIACGVGGSLWFGIRDRAE
ncbi:MAG: MFS transporter [Gemmataceae bacterium]